MFLWSGISLTILKIRCFSTLDYVDEMIREVKKKNLQTKHPFFEQNNDNKKNAFVVVTSDRGLCGSFNTEMLRKTNAFLAKNKNTDLICIGKRAYDTLKKEYEVYSKFTGLFNEMDFSVAKNISNLVLDLYLNKGYFKVTILYNEFISAIQQEVVLKQLLPIIPSDNKDISSTDFLYEPNDEIIIEELGKKHIAVEIWRILLESSAAEQGARMTAMDNATENATELIDKLSLQYNRERQSAITTEILEIVSGAEAINE